MLVSESFDAIPFAIEEGRRILRNVQRVAKLFVAKSVFAATLILTVGVGGGAFPFLPRQLSLAAAITVGIPAFFLALAPAAQAPQKPFMRDVAAFAIPAGLVLGIAVLLGHGLVHTSLDRSAQESQTTSTTILVFVGLYLVLVLESGSMRRSRIRGALVPLLVVALAASYLVVLSDPGPARRVRARRADRAPDDRQHHLHDVRDRRARPARPVADASRRRAGAGRALLAPCVRA